MGKFFVPDGYVGIRTSTLAPDKVLGTDVYVLINARPVRWAMGGEVLDRSRSENMRKHKKRKVLIKADDEQRYRSYMEAALDSTLSDDSISIEDKVASSSGAAETAYTDIKKNPGDEASYKSACMFFDKLGKVFESLEGGVGHILNLPFSEEHYDHSAHGLQIAALTVSVCQKLDLVKSESKRNAIITGAFLHDVSMDIAGMSRAEVEEARIARSETWVNHAKGCTDILNGKDFVDQQVLDILLQHEERPDGSGVPGGINKFEIDPVAAIVSLASAYEHQVYLARGDRKEAFKAFYQDSLGCFDLDQVNVVKNCLKQAGVEIA